MIKCSECEYTTMRKFNLERHHFNKHNKKEQKNINEVIISNLDVNISHSDVNISHSDVNISHSDVNISHSEDIIESTENNKKFNCKKCNKSYNTTKYLNNHETTCKGISILTCPKCMKTFKHHSSKSKHIKINNP